MLDIGKDRKSDPICQFSHVRLPHHIDDHQPPTKKKPFSCATDRPFVHTVDILLPKPHSDAALEQLRKTTGQFQYAKVFLKLRDIIEHDFFNNYIKSGDVVLLSEGRPGVDNTFSLNDGILRLELDKPTYERAGLVGKAIPSPGKKHVKARFAIDLNLRLPSMVRGRKLFNRIVYAFDNVLTDTLTWLFFDRRDPSLAFTRTPTNASAFPKESEKTCPQSIRERQTDNLTSTTTPSEKSADGVDGSLNDATSETKSRTKDPEQSPQHEAPLKKHHPIICAIEPKSTLLEAMRTPAFPSRLDDGHKETAADLLEWLCLAMSGCTRLREGDGVDATISRYSVPDLVGTTISGGVGEVAADSPTSKVSASTNGAETTGVHDLSRLRYHGFLTSYVAAKILTAVIRTSAKERTWVALRMQCLGGKDDCTIMVRDGEAMVWEYS